MDYSSSRTTVAIIVISFDRVQRLSLGKSPLHHSSIEVTAVNIMPFIDFRITKSYQDFATIIASIIMAKLKSATMSDSHKMPISSFELSICHLS